MPRLCAYDEIVKVLISDDRCGITVRRFVVREFATETRLTSARLITQAWVTDDTGKWKPVVMEVDGSPTTEFSIPDETWKPLIISHRGGKTVDEYRDMLSWDALCARPGSGRLNQRDYADVQRETTKKWNKVLGKSDYWVNYPGSTTP